MDARLASLSHGCLACLAWPGGLVDSRRVAETRRIRRANFATSKLSGIEENTDGGADESGLDDESELVRLTGVSRVALG